MAERKSVLVRLRPEVYAELQRWAADEFRSVNGQIEFIFEQALRDAGRRSRSAADPGGKRGPRPISPAASEEEEREPE